MRKLLSAKLFDRARQYGLRAASTQILRSVFRKIYRVDRNIIFIIPEFSGFAFEDPSISALTSERINRAMVTEEMSLDHPGEVFDEFLDEGCRGICVEIEGSLAGYAWVQFSGEYRFGRSGRMVIPTGFVVMKNLYVNPNFRGLKIGRKLNAARLAMIPSGQTPVGFILPENHYAIRNWQKYGFEPVLEVKQCRWLCCPWKTTITTLSDHGKTCVLLKALETSNHG
jgi:ribosomal protein S18 acetylase RimI-like enzyme